jgi:glycosyltransferase involved in cell wall biosynthesis
MRPFVSRTVVNSTLLQRDHAQWLGIDAAEISVCANGISASPLNAADAKVARAEIRAKYGIAPDAVVITNVGRFSAEKGQQSIVDANAILREKPDLPPFVWLACGDGPTLPAITQAAAARQMHNIVFAGRTTAVREVLAASDVFVMPSDFEGMPNAMMEAMAAGLPCVSTNLTGALDVARDGQEALYYEPRDAVRLAAHLETLLRDPELARAMGARAQTRVHEFSVARFVDTFDTILEGVTARPAPRARQATNNLTNGRPRLRLRSPQAR